MDAPHLTLGCKPSGGEQEGPTADTGGAGGSSGGLTPVTGAPGEGLPTSLPSGLLVLAVRASFDSLAMPPKVYALADNRGVSQPKSGLAVSP